MKLPALCVLVLLVASTSARIKNVVVLMEENRSFDHMLGFLNAVDPRINGLNGKETNPRNTSDPAAGSVSVNQNGYDVGPDDPCHGHSCTTEQIYGYAKPENVTATPKMDGFVQNAVEIKHTDYNVMSMFNHTSVPIISTLALEFANFDRMFCSYPGPTYPNRQFVHSATAHGEVDDEVPTGGFPQTTIYERFRDSGLDWSVYYEGDNGMVWAIFMSYLRSDEAKPHLKTMDQFYAEAKAGTLPTYAFIEPRVSTNKSSHDPSYGLPNHQHPDASVREGERLMKNVYEAVRAGPQWNESALIITYDEHGGFYDHVTPPQVGVPNPDGIKSKVGFNYDRLGIRIPTIVISPWVEKNTLVSGPLAPQMPTSTSEYELSSIPATMIKMFGLKGGFLTKRDAWAATFENLFEARDEPRTDCPMTLPDVPPPAASEYERQGALPLNSHQTGQIEMLCEMNGLPRSCGSHITRGDQVAEFTGPLFQRWMNQ